MLNSKVKLCLKCLGTWSNSKIFLISRGRGGGLRLRKNVPVSRSALGPNQPPIQWVLGGGGGYSLWANWRDVIQTTPLGRSIKFLLALASTVIPGFRSGRDPWQDVCSLLNMCLSQTGGSLRPGKCRSSC